jgi:hypothetical protein
MRSVMIKGMWKSKDKILLMFLIGQVSCSFSFSTSLLPLSNDVSHVSVKCIATTIAPACETLMLSVILLLIPCLPCLGNCTARLCTDAAATLLLKTGFQSLSAQAEWRNMATFFVTLCFLLVLPVNCNFFAKFFDIMTKIIWSWNLESSDQKPKVNMLLTELAKPWARWWRPGRVETSRRSGGFERAWTRSPRALSVVRASQTHPSLIPRCQHFLSHHFALDGAQCALPCEASTVLDFT